MLPDTADEAQALLHPQMMKVETGRIRDGVVERAEVIEIPEAFFSSVQSAVVEQLTMARNATLHDYPAMAANSIVELLAKDNVIARSDAKRVRDLVELEIRRGIEHLATDARDRYARRLPVSLRLLIPLITRRSGK